MSEKYQSESDARLDRAIDSQRESIKSFIAKPGANVAWTENHGQHVKEMLEQVRKIGDQLIWTIRLNGLEEALTSATSALMRLMSGSRYMREEAKGTFEGALERIRCGDLAWDSEELLRLIVHAQISGRDRIFIEIVDAFDAARKRVSVKPQYGIEKLNRLFGDGNDLRDRVVIWWLFAGFWLMSDDTISVVVDKLGIRPGCSRQAISRLVEELGLVKGPKIIKGIKPDFTLIFEDGYPPGGQ